MKSKLMGAIFLKTVQKLLFSVVFAYCPHVEADNSLFKAPGIQKRKPAYLQHLTVPDPSGVCPYGVPLPKVTTEISHLQK